MKKNRRYSSAEKEQMLSQFFPQKELIAAYCKRIGVPVSTFRMWYKTAQSTPSPFLSVEISQDSTPSHQITISKSGFEVSVLPQFDKEQLSQILTILNELSH